MFAVIWRDSALDELADAFVLADPATREMIMRAVSRFNAQLASDPAEVGESRSDRQRLAFDPPCAIIFLVNDPPGVIRVTRFWLPRGSSAK